LTTFYNGQPFGLLMLPNASFQAFAATTFIQTGVLEIHNPAVFSQQASDLVLGNSITWRLSGPITVSFTQLGLTLNLDLHIEKDIILNGGAIENAEADNLTVIEGFPDYILGTVDQKMYNPSNIELTGLGTVVMYSFDEHGNHIAEATIPDFSIISGWNYQKNISVKTLAKRNDPVQMAAVTRFVSNWAMGIDQPLVLKGPISASSGAAYLLNVSTCYAVMRGNRLPLVLNGSLVAGSGGLPSGSQRVQNPLGTTVYQSAFNFRVYQNLSGYSSVGVPDYTAYQSTSLGISCPATNIGPIMGLAYPYTLTLAPNEIKDVGLTISFASLINTIDYCNAYLFTATCCSLYAGGFGGPTNSTPPNIFVNTEGTFNVTIDQFNITQYLAVAGVPVSCFPYSDSMCGSSIFQSVCNPTYPGLYCPFPNYYTNNNMAVHS